MKGKACIVEVFYKKGVFDAAAVSARHGMAELGISGAASVVISQLYRIESSLTAAEIRSLAKNALTDPVVQDFKVYAKDTAKHQGYAVSVWYKSGVTDATGDSVLIACKDMGIKGIDTVSTGAKYVIKGKLKPADIKRICERMLANTVIQTYEIKK